MSFFGDEAVAGALEHLAEANHVTLVVGAGSSAEAGMPTWSELIDRLLRRLGKSRGMVGDDLEGFCDWTARSEGLLGAAAVVEANVEEAEFRRWVREELYREMETGRLTPGPSAEACARIKGLLKDRCELVTTNYDPILLNAAKEEGALAGGSVQVAVDDKPATGTEAFVRHLHGFATPTQTRGVIVLAEGQYHDMQDGQAWQEAFMRQRLLHSACLFAGTSLTDPNLLRYLYRSHGGPDDVAVFTRQQEAEQRRSATPALNHQRDGTLRQRWTRLGVRPLLADYYTESAQFLWELASALEDEELPTPYQERLSDWESIISRELLARRAPQRFVSRQDVLQEVLADELRRVLETLADDGHEPIRGERLGAHLWAHLPSRQSLVVGIGASDRAWRDPSTLVPIPIGWETVRNWAAVQAFCSGSVTSRSTSEQVATRWNHVVGFPVHSHGPPWGRLPVGALTLASTYSEQRSVLGRGLGTLRELSRTLTERAAALLVPT